MTEKDRPLLPPPAWYTLEDVAQRWGCKIEQVIHYGETGMLRISAKTQGVLEVRWEKEFIELGPEAPWKNTPHGILGLTSGFFVSLIESDVPQWMFFGVSTTKDEKEDYCAVRGFSPELQPYAFAKDLVIVREELDRFEREYRIGAHAGELPAPDSLTKWPWGEHETKLLRTLADAAKRFWVNYAPGEPDTAPTNAAVVQFLEKNGVSGNIAKAMATILRADDLPAGRKKVEP
jgi:hypothetical protein